MDKRARDHIGVAGGSNPPHRINNEFIFLKCAVTAHFKIFLAKEEQDEVKNKTYANMCRATAMIAEKGYDWDKANEIAIQVFEQAKVSRNGMSIEWYISKIATVGPAAGV